MVSTKSLDTVSIINSALTDLAQMQGSVFNTRALPKTLKQVQKRCGDEGVGFLTRTLPKLGKAFDKALAGGTLRADECGFQAADEGCYPRFLGELFSTVISPEGKTLPEPSIDSIRNIRQIAYLFYKYELPYTHDQEQQVIDAFKGVEDGFDNILPSLPSVGSCYEDNYSPRQSCDNAVDPKAIARNARELLYRLFEGFDPRDIRPRHGPGAVSTKETLHEKYLWTNIPAKLTDYYPVDEYFYVNVGHVCDRLQEFKLLTSDESPAKVVLVPKDSRGPRLISCEPLAYQWIQQGLSRSIVERVEQHPLTKWSVYFTDQIPNRLAALHGSKDGRYATLDLKEASDRVSLKLVQLLFPYHLLEALEASRSVSTKLPNGEVQNLRKFAPMGSALCFPILALTVWSLLRGGLPDVDDELIHVYGDDVIVPRESAERAICILETFGLKVNRDKSCTSGLFRESCGMDAYKGVDVTPVRIRTVWTEHRSPEAYASWIAYANSLWSRRFTTTAELIRGRMERIYGSIPCGGQTKSAPCFDWQPANSRPLSRRWNPDFQKFEYRMLVLRSPKVYREIDGWSMLLRYLVEAGSPPSRSTFGNDDDFEVFTEKLPFAVRVYTRRRASILVRRWR